MTLIHFSYTENYHTPAKGTVVFMPHRRHAANETEVLPKPFHRKLVGGELTVDLEPTEPTWVWSVTHNDVTMFYTIPEHDGVLEHTELIPIAPSTLPTANNSVEPAWWAEIRQYKTLMANALNTIEKQHRESLHELRKSATDFNTALQDAARHESMAGAYSRQAQASNEQAWEASKAPGGFAEQAEAEAERALIYRDEANEHRIESARQADRSYDEATRANTHADRAQDEADRSRDEADRSNTSADDANTHASRAETHANESAAARNEAVEASVEAVEARDEAVEARDEAIEARDDSIAAAELAETVITNGVGEWQPIGPLLNGWEVSGSAGDPEYRIFFDNIQIRGTLNSTEATDNLIAVIENMPQIKQTTTFFVESSAGYSRLRLSNNGELTHSGDIGDGMVRTTLNNIIPLA